MDADRCGRRYFVISDVHSFYTEMMDALDEAGYDKSNPSHFLISCGDILDRGGETLKVLEFLRSIPKDHRILVRGNHEVLLRDCYNRGSFKEYDFNNGTVRSMCHLSGIDPDMSKTLSEKYRKGLLSFEGYIDEHRAWWEEMTTAPFKNDAVKSTIEWMFSDEWVNYFELGRFIFVHSWVPTREMTMLDTGRHIGERVLENWRKASDAQWEEAMWGCPWKHYLNGARHVAR